MAKEAIEKPRNVEPQPDEEQAKESGKTPSWRRFLNRKWIIAIIAVSVVLHGMGFLYYQFTGKSGAKGSSLELNLGTFQFEANQDELGGIEKAEFSLHIALLDQVDQEARQRLENRKFRVQQDIEELLREAHSGEFDDTKLGQLKRQLQEQINETLGMRAIADVIITDLRIQRSDEASQDAADVAETVPWAEKPST